MSDKISGPMGATNKIAIVDPRPVTAGYALSFVVALLVLGVISLAWTVFFVIALVLLVIEGAGFPLLAVGATGYLLMRAWRAMAQTMRYQLRASDVADFDALPSTFGLLSKQLQRVVQVTRTTRAAVADVGLTAPAVSRELFYWLMALRDLEGDDARYLEDRGWSVEKLRSEIIDLERSQTPHLQADTLLSRFEASLLNRPADPFR